MRSVIPSSQSNISVWNKFGKSTLDEPYSFICYFTFFKRFMKNHVFQKLRKSNFSVVCQKKQKNFMSKTSSSTEDETKKCWYTHPICQQELRGCHLMIDHRPRFLFAALALFYLFVAVFLLAVEGDFIEYKVRYDDKCNTSDTITVNINIEKQLKGNLFFYYELHNFYQNHFRFRGSQDRDQFHGRYVDSPSECAPFIRASDDAHTLAPCGLMPIYFFNDYYTLPAEYNFQENGISWDGEIGKLFNPINENYTGPSRWMLTGIQAEYFPGELQNEHFINWMRTANNPTFKKLFAKAHGTIPKGDFPVTVTCNFDKDIFVHERYISIVRPSMFGGRNRVLYISSFVLVAFLIVGIIIFSVKKSNRSAESFVEIQDVPQTP